MNPNTVSVTAASERFKCETCELRSHAICGALQDEELREMNSIVRQVSLETGQIVFFEGDPATFAFNVTKGVVRLSKMLLDGRRQVTGFLYPGDFLGLAASKGYIQTAEAITPVRMCRFDRRNLTRMYVKFPKLEHRLLEVACNEIVLAQDQMMLLGRKTARERLSTFLRNLLSRSGLNERLSGEIELPMDRGDIADYLGLTKETVSRTFTLLRDEGLIEMPSTTRIVIPDVDGLADAAENLG
jgi:CRP/FNR family transcriptional regulator, anaerobic regulatory protein